MKQFDFARNWRKKIVPILNTPSVENSLFAGMRLQGDGFVSGDPPWLHGRGPDNGQRAKKGCLSWYQPWGRCHSIAPFAWAIGMALEPNLTWGFFTGDFHTVAVGFEKDPERPEVVMDILQFRRFTAEDSIAFVKEKNPKYYKSFVEYAASFCKDPKAALKALRELQR
jgi:hypothetical protein